MNRKALAAAFPVTVPVLMGYLSIGIAFGLMLERAGYNFIWAFFMSLTIYAGSGQYLGVELLATAAGLGTVAVMTLLINFRHLVYGLSMLEKFRGMGWRKFYMIFPLPTRLMPCWPAPTCPWACAPGISTSPWLFWTSCTGSPGRSSAAWPAGCCLWTSPALTLP